MLTWSKLEASLFIKCEPNETDKSDRVERLAAFQTFSLTSEWEREVARTIILQFCVH